MQDLHEVFSAFKEEYPHVYAEYEALGKEIHEKSGPLSDKVRWLIKIAISGASRHSLALETHIVKAREAGVTDAEIK
ncbi:MAG: carboxymuconolactone decarboxylase family protein, partial [bacterium]|nr:carboxymuconolactone decarboxylase family protein [bacterium]